MMNIQITFRQFLEILHESGQQGPAAEGWTAAAGRAKQQAEPAGSASRPEAGAADAAAE
jgi:hypothetical protein